METSEVLVDAFERIRGVTHNTVDGLSPEVLAFRPDPDANSIAWLVVAPDEDPGRSHRRCRRDRTALDVSRLVRALRRCRSRRRPSATGSRATTSLRSR